MVKRIAAVVLLAVVGLAGSVVIADAADARMAKGKVSADSGDRMAKGGRCC